MIKLKNLIKEYFINSAKPFLLLQDGKLLSVKDTDHLSAVVEYYDELYDDIMIQFQSTFGEKLNFSEYSDVEYYNECIKDFMKENNIFPVIVDLNDKRVYVRPVLGKKPSTKQLKDLKDWAIENGFDSDIKIDTVFA